MKKDSSTTTSLAASSAAHSYDWLLAIPSKNSTTLSDDHFKIARLRIGLPPWAIMPHYCYCEKSLNKDPWHYLSCNRERGRSHTKRHDAVKLLLQKWADSSNAIFTQLEPTGLDPITNKRPDLLIEYSDKAYLVDVSVRHPIALSYVSTNSKPLSTTTKAAKHKKEKYHDMSRSLECSLVPFICETTGGAEAFVGTLLPSR